MFVKFYYRWVTRGGQQRRDERRSVLPLRRWYWHVRRYVSRRQVITFQHDGKSWPVRYGNGPDIGITDGAGPQAEGIVRAVAARGGLPLPVVQARLQAGHRIVHASTAEAGLLAWGWIVLPGLAMGVGFESGLSLEIGDGMSYLYDFVTLSAARGQGLYRQLLDYAAHFCLAHGAVTVGIYCRAENLASHRGIVAAGFQDARMVTVLRLGPWARLTVLGRSWWCRVGSRLTLRTFIGTDL